jgi:hypothetical protein
MLLRGLRKSFSGDRGRARSDRPCTRVLVEKAAARRQLHGAAPRRHVHWPALVQHATWAGIRQLHSEVSVQVSPPVPNPQVCVSALQVPRKQSPSTRHWTHVFVSVSQAGVVPPPQLVSVRHSTQVPVSSLQMGASGLQSPLSEHARSHVPVFSLHVRSSPQLVSVRDERYGSREAHRKASLSEVCPRALPIPGRPTGRPAIYQTRTCAGYFEHPHPEKPSDRPSRSAVVVTQAVQRRLVAPFKPCVCWIPERCRACPSSAIPDATCTPSTSTSRSRASRTACCPPGSDLLSGCYADFTGLGPTYQFFDAEFRCCFSEDPRGE